MFRLLRYFSIASAAVIVVVIALLMVFFRHLSTEDLVSLGERQNEILSRSIGNNIWSRFGPYISLIKDADNKAVLNKVKTREMSSELSAQIKGLPVMKIDIINRKGLTIFSTEEKKIGSKKNMDAHFAAVRDGRAASKLTPFDAGAYPARAAGKGDVLSSYLPFRDDEGNVVGVIGIYSDITLLLADIDRHVLHVFLVLLAALSLLYVVLHQIVRRADNIIKSQHAKLQSSENALRESEGKNRALLEGSPVCNKIIDLDSRLRYMSAAGVKQLKYPDIETYYGDVYPPDFYPEAMRAPLTEHLERAKAGEISSIESPLLDFEGQEVWYHTTFVPVRDDEGRVEYIIATSVNITERKLAEEKNMANLAEKDLLLEKIRHLNENLEERVKERGEQLSQEIAERLKAEEISRQHYDQLVHVARVNSLGEMASGLAHEINQPLLAIRSYAEGCLHHLRSGKSDKKELMEVIGDIVLQAGRAGEIIQNIRDLLRKDEGKKDEIDLNAAIEEVTNLLGGEFNNSNVTVRLDLAEPLRKVSADRIQIEQVILNIARNGIEAMSGNGAAERIMRISTSADNRGNVEMAVEDTGGNFAALDPEVIFEPFFTTKKEGLGMGLSICRSIIETHGGRIWASANPRGGATVSFTLPTED